MANELQHIFASIKTAQKIYNETIAKEHSDFMQDFIDAIRNPNMDADDVPKPFQDQLETAGKQRDAFGHMISIFEAKRMMLEMITDDKAEIQEHINGLYDLTYDNDSLTGMPVTLTSTTDLSTELTELLSSDHNLNDTELKIAQRMQTGCKDLIDTVTQMQSLCCSLYKNSTQAKNTAKKHTSPK